MNHIQTLTEKNRALDILEKAFITSPGVTWMLKKRNRKSLRVFLSAFFEEACTKKGAYLTSDNNGVVLFYQLQNQRTSLMCFLKKLYMFLFIMGPIKGWRAIKYKKMIDDIRPKSGWFGWLVATDLDAADTKAAYEIKQDMFKLADQTNEPIFLETTQPRVMVLYKAAGYYEYAKIKHPYEDIYVWFMRRDPHTFRKVNKA